MNRRKAYAAKRKAGLRPITIWVPDTRREGFAEECRRQSLSLRNDVYEREVLVRLASAADAEGWL